MYRCGQILCETSVQFIKPNVNMFTVHGVWCEHGLSIAQQHSVLHKKSKLNINIYLIRKTNFKFFDYIYSETYNMSNI